MFEQAWNSQFGVRRPGRIVCLGRNYAAHAEEEGVELPPDHPFAGDVADGTTQMGSGRPS